MNEALIGEVVTLRAPSSDRLAGLIAATAGAMLEAGDGEPRDDAGVWIPRIEAALADSDGAGSVTARLILQIDGLVIRLHRGDDDEPHATVHCGA